MPEDGQSSGSELKSPEELVSEQTNGLLKNRSQQAPRGSFVAVLALGAVAIVSAAFAIHVARRRHPHELNPAERALVVTAESGSRALETPVPPNSSQPYQKLMGGMDACPTGLEIKSVQECEHAVQQLGLRGFAVNKTWVGTHPQMPRWCAVDVVGKDSGVKFGGSDSGGVASSDMSPICKSAKAEGPPGCQTARPGDKCYRTVVNLFLDKMTGQAVQGSYPDFSFYWRLEDAQAKINSNSSTTCPIPCHAPSRRLVSLFCFSVFRSTGYEKTLMYELKNYRLGAFGCDDSAAITDAEFDLGNGFKTLVIPPDSVSMNNVGKSKDGYAANAYIFLAAWNVIFMDFRYHDYDFTVKVDPDAVLIPDRLLAHLNPKLDQKVFIKNCDRWVGGGMMYGALEVFSRQALIEYFKDAFGAKRCRNEIDWHVVGEDDFMEKCMNKLGVQGDYDSTLLNDARCHTGDCTVDGVAAFHPYKNYTSYMSCLEQAVSP